MRPTLFALVVYLPHYELCPEAILMCYFVLGIPTLMYGIAATMLITYKEPVHFPEGMVYIYFLLKEDTGAQY